MVTYYAVYENGTTGDRITIHAINPELVPKTRTFRAAGGTKKYRRIKVKATKRKVIVVAKTAKKGKKKEDLIDDELDELEEIEDLDDLEDEEEPEDDEEETDEDEDEDEEEEEDDEDEDDEEDEEDEDEEPAPKRKSKKSKSTPSRSRTIDGKVGTQDLASAAGTDARTVRMYLRKNKVQKDEEVGRYEWPSVKNKEFQKHVKALKAGAGEAAKKESLDKLKASKKKDTGAARTKTKATGTKKKTKKS